MYRRVIILRMILFTFFIVIWNWILYPMLLLFENWVVSFGNMNREKSCKKSNCHINGLLLYVIVVYFSASVHLVTKDTHWHFLYLHIRRCCHRVCKDFQYTTCHTTFDITCVVPTNVVISKRLTYNIFLFLATVA